MKKRIAFLLAEATDEGLFVYYRLIRNKSSRTLTTDFTAAGFMTPEEMEALQDELRGVKRGDEDSVGIITQRHVIAALPRILEPQLGKVVADSARTNFAQAKKKTGEIFVLPITVKQPSTHVVVLPFTSEIFDHIPTELQEDLVAVQYVAIAQ